MKEIRTRIRTCLWYDHCAEEAAGYYTSLLPDSEIEHIFRADRDGPITCVDFTLAGAPYKALNGGSSLEPTRAASLYVLCDDQEEVDRLWNRLIADGGHGGRCGWLTDRYGIPWQVVPEILPILLSDEDREASGRVRQAMLGMERFEIVDLLAARDNARELPQPA